MCEHVHGVVIMPGKAGVATYLTVYHSIVYTGVVLTTGQLGYL